MAEKKPKKPGDLNKPIPVTVTFDRKFFKRIVQFRVKKGMLSDPEAIRMMLADALTRAGF